MWVFPWHGRHSPACSFHLSLVLFLGPRVPREATPPPASPAELSCSWVSVIPVFCAGSFLSYLTHPLFAGDIFSLRRGDKLFEGKGSVFRHFVASQCSWPSARGAHLPPPSRPPALTPIKTVFSKLKRIMYLLFASP